MHRQDGWKITAGPGNGHLEVATGIAAGKDTVRFRAVDPRSGGRCVARVQL